MGRLRQPDSGRVFELEPETLVGRSAACHLRLVHESASHVHASLRWQDGGWQLQDRNSTNGTWVDGVCLSRGKSQSLTPGCSLRFGAKRSEEWQLFDGSPPSFGLPVAATAAHERVLSDVELLIRADLGLEVTVGGELHRLPARVPYIVLQALALERLSDRGQGRSEADEGWVDRETLSRRLRRPELNQDIRRIREDFRKLQLFEAAEDVIETLREQGKVRLGIPRVRVEQ